MPTPTDPQSTGAIAEIIAYATAAATAVVLGIQKVTKIWGDARKDVSRNAAQVEVVDGLRQELSRMSEQNGKLADALNELQNEVIALRAENAELHVTVRQLRSEVARLRQSGAATDFGG